MIRIMIVDDHVLLTDSLRMVLESYREFEIIGTAHNGQEAVEKCLLLKPDVVLMDIKMPVMDGLEAALAIKQNMPGIKVIILTSLEEEKYVVSAFVNGIDAYILKDTPPDHLRKLIECVFAGFYVMSDSVKDFLQEECIRPRDVQAPPCVLESLKDEDIEIIRCISEGKNNGEIAEQFGYAIGTVKNKITRLLEITGTGNRAQLVMFALRSNLL